MLGAVRVLKFEQPLYAPISGWPDRVRDFVKSLEIDFVKSLPTAPAWGLSPEATGAHRSEENALPPKTLQYRGYSKLRTHTALGTYGRSLPRDIGPV